MVSPSTVILHFLACSLNITLVLPRCKLRPAWFACPLNVSDKVVNSSGDLGNKMISSAQIRWERYSPSIFRPLPSKSILFMIACWRHAVKYLGEKLSPCLAPLSSLIFSLWSFRTEVAPFYKWHMIVTLAWSNPWFYKQENIERRRTSILGDPRAVCRVERKGAESTNGRAPGYRIAANHFQKLKGIVTPDWTQKMLLYIIVLNLQAAYVEFFSCIPTRLLLSRQTCSISSPRLSVKGKLSYLLP